MRQRAALPAHPYRDSAILYGAMAVIVVVVSLFTGGGVVRGIVIAVVFFVVATGWTWIRFRQRIGKEGK